MSPTLKETLPGRWNQVDAEISTPLHCLKLLLESSAEWQLGAVVMVLRIICHYGSYRILEESKPSHTTVLAQPYDVCLPLLTENEI